ncbi:MAG: nucleoside hydrolase [Acidimicrobiales bacterium]
MTPRRRILIDTDPGIDDAMAIAAALAAPELEVVGLTTVFGNHHVDVTTANACRVLDHLGAPEIPVVPGAARALVRAGHRPATMVHGDDGLGDADLPAAVRRPVGGRRAAEYLVEQILADPGTLTIVALGPLTNLALALHLEPRVAEAVEQVVLMGGAFAVPGNVTPTSEANIWNDPHAAHQVFGAGWPLMAIGLDVTHRLHADRAWLDRVATVDTPAARLVSVTAPTYVRFHQETDGLDGIHCHDVATIVALVRPDVLGVVAGPVQVVTDGLAAGQTVLGRGGAVGDESWAARPDVDVALEVDTLGAMDLVHELLSADPARHHPQT